MVGKKHTNRLLSHNIKQADLDQVIMAAQQRITAKKDLQDANVAQQLDLLEQLTQFDLGRFLLMNGGLNGYWTHYILTHPQLGRKNEKVNLSTLETFLLDQAPAILATQQRFDIFLRENQVAVANNAVLACIPCGLMGELLYLNFKDIDHISLVGIDLDSESLQQAKLLASKHNVSAWTDFKQEDAWHLNAKDSYDLITSNGLNIYEPDDNKVTKLYRQFYLALKPGGKLVTSFLTSPPDDTNTCEWVIDEINQHDLLLQKILFVDTLTVKWQCYRSSKQTESQLRSAGFNDIKFIYDQAKMFPTVTAIKL